MSRVDPHRGRIAVATGAQDASCSARAMTDRKDERVRSAVARAPSAPSLPARGERPATCISADELAALIAGDVAPERVEAILVHVDHCTACAEVITNLAQLEADPRELGRYQLGSVLGSGAMGIVYAAWDSQLQRHVALKLVRPERNDADAHARMLREARALARISHPNVVAVYDVTEHAGQICVATELVDGDTLAVWQRGREP